MLTQQSISAVILQCPRIENLTLPCFIYPHASPTSDTSTFPIINALLDRPPQHHQFKTLGLSMCSGSIINSQLPKLLEKHPSLRRLELVGSIALTAACTPSLAMLSHLVVASTGMVDDDFAFGIAESCAGLRHLNLSHCQISAVGMGRLLQKCTNLQLLFLAFNRQLQLTSLVERGSESLDGGRDGTDGGSRTGMGQVRSLTLLSLGLCQTAVSDTCVRAIRHIAPNITNIDLSHCQYIKNQTDVGDTIKSLRRLSKINLSCCDKLLGTVAKLSEQPGLRLEAGLKQWSDPPPERVGKFLRFLLLR